MAAREPAGPSTPTTTVFCCGVFVMSPLLGLSGVGPGVSWRHVRGGFVMPSTARRQEGQTHRPKASPWFERGRAACGPGALEEKPSVTPCGRRQRRVQVDAEGPLGDGGESGGVFDHDPARLRRPRRPRRDPLHLRSCRGTGPPLPIARTGIAGYACPMPPGGWTVTLSTPYYRGNG